MVVLWNILRLASVLVPPSVLFNHSIKIGNYDVCMYVCMHANTTNDGVITIINMYGYIWTHYTYYNIFAI